MKGAEKALNQLLEEMLIGICKAVKAIFVGIFRGIKKLNSLKKFLLFFGFCLFAVLTTLLLKGRILQIQTPVFVRYILYDTLLMLPLIVLFVLGSIRPAGRKEFEAAFTEIDFKGKDGRYPYLCETKEEDKKRIYIFQSNIPVEEWRNRKALLETAFDCTILKIENGNSKRIVRVTTLPSDFRIPEKIDWQDALIRESSGVITVGKSALSEITFDLNRVPHVLAAGETGSGKSVILRLILWQFINQGSRVYMFDFKGGVEFGIDYEQYGEVVTERKRALQVLTMLEEENAQRLTLFRNMRVKNIVEYNKKTGKNLCRVGVFCDELAEMMDKKGSSKEQKELMEKIEGKISTLARLSRATGINLILGMQRPDANVLTGQIKNNIPVRISGRFADKTASEIVLGSTDACNIPDIKGRFICKVGNEMQQFQAYYFDDETMLKDVSVEVGGMLTGTPGDVSEKAFAEVPAGKSERAPKPTQKAEENPQPVSNPYEGMSEEEFEKEKAAMDEYDLNLDFFG